MKKYLIISLMILCVLMLAACGKKEKHTIEILVPVGSTEDFVYSVEEINPIGNKIKIWAGAGLSDTEVILKPVTDKVETGYVAEYLTHGAPVEFDVDNAKDQWFKIGVSVQNDSDKGPIAVSVEVEDVEVRIAERDEAIFEATVLEVHDGYYLVKPVDGSRELNSADKIEVPIKNLDPSIEPEVGDVIEITYDGMIMELYPAILHEVYRIKVVEEAIKHTQNSIHDEAISFHDKTFNKSDLSQETIEWLEWYNRLSADEQIAISYIPTELCEICGYPTAEDMVAEETKTQ